MSLAHLDDVAFSMSDAVVQIIDRVPTPVVAGLAVGAWALRDVLQYVSEAAHDLVPIGALALVAAKLYRVWYGPPMNTVQLVGGPAPSFLDFLLRWFRPRTQTPPNSGPAPRGGVSMPPLPPLPPFAPVATDGRPDIPAGEEGDPVWLAIARGELGTLEGRGLANNPKVLGYYRDAGHPEIKADSVAWCAAFVGAVLKRAGKPPSGSLAARSYLNWGRPLAEPRVGCVVVLSRGANAWEGHVGFCVGETATGVRVLAGNQGDAVCVKTFPKARVLGYRWPVSAAGNVTTLVSAVGGTVGLAAVSAGAVALDPQLFDSWLAIGAELKELAQFAPHAALAGGVVIIGAHVCQFYVRLRQYQAGGR